MVGRFAPHGLRHFGQGKWYPGESLPRWSLTCHFRTDGEPLWRDPALVARPGGSTPQAAQIAELGAAVCERLGVNADHLRPGYEDSFYYLWKERRLPVNLDPRDNRLAWEEERARVARVFEQGLDHVVGYALPLRAYRDGAAIGFQSGELFLRSEHLCLVPGDSPMGYRLPLGSLPWAAASDLRFVPEPDPFGTPPPLPRRGEARRQDPRRRGAPPVPTQAPARYASAGDALRTALCIEIRDGMAHVFMPPMPDAGCYFALTEAIEEAAEALATPVRLEGYAPPRDPRVQSFSVTPDPGVIEVNIHPSTDWGELSERTRTVYALAREARLGADKFLLDGRHVGTGGGNHVTLGAETPSDSPLLRRPDLLRSLVGYWLDHPSLSYLFSGLFIGPTSQAPRVDEARHEAVRELEVAFEELDRQGDHAPPWLVDRLFRHLLTDVTGNTHRAEFCIDKLYSPEGPSGRQGLLELRALRDAAAPGDEPHPGAAPALPRRLLLGSAPPDARPALGDPAPRPLHAAPLRRPGLRRRARRPRGVGAAPRDRVVLAPLRVPLPPGRRGGLRRRGAGAAHRPGAVERARRGGRGRRHGALRRLEPRAAPAQDPRRPLGSPRVCSSTGGRRRSAPTGTQGEAVAGVRFRAWQPPSCLHPTIGVHSPLRVEVVDRDRSRSLGGCTYHVAHPDGRAYDRFPVNAEEAGARRRARFVPFGHTPGELAIPGPVVDRGRAADPGPAPGAPARRAPLAPRPARARGRPERALPIALLIRLVHRLPSPGPELGRVLVVGVGPTEGALVPAKDRIGGDHRRAHGVPQALDGADAGQQRGQVAHDEHHVEARVPLDDVPLVAHRHPHARVVGLLAARRGLVVAVGRLG